MSKPNKQASEEPGTEARESFEATLSLKPAEFEALIARLCACGTRRVKSGGRTRRARECGHRVRAQWCRVGDRGWRLGERGKGAIRLVDTKFG
jgi:hypothetical protein